MRRDGGVVGLVADIVRTTTPTDYLLLRRPLAPRLRHRHDLQQVTIRIFEVKATAATALVNLPVGVIERPAAIRQPLALHPTEYCLKFRVADVEGIVMTAGPGIEFQS